MKGLILSIGLLIFSIQNVWCMNPKAKVVVQVATYGTVGGALLGAASMAFGSPTRRVFQGASLGLYAGLLFGSYIVVSHSGAFKSDQESYPASPGPYQDNFDQESGVSTSNAFLQKMEKKEDKVIAYFPVLNYRF